MIKYKGITSNLLTELSMKLSNTVNLNQSEHILIQFFQCLVQDLSTEKKVQLICTLPVHLKPFCTASKYHKTRIASVTVTRPFKKNLQSILTILKKYMSEDAYLLMCNYLPDTAAIKSSTLPEKVFLVA
jgi:hypothetical protein